jgi:hypothetical protein
MSAVGIGTSSAEWEKTRAPATTAAPRATGASSTRHAPMVTDEHGGAGR